MIKVFGIGKREIVTKAAEKNADERGWCFDRGTGKRYDEERM